MRDFFRTYRGMLGEDPWFDLFFLYVILTDLGYIFLPCS